MRKRKILVIYTGGTFGMDEKLKVPKLSPVALKKGLLAQVPEMERMVDCDVLILFNVDSCQMNSSHWLRLTHEIRSREKSYEGAVVLHGTDTLAYSAAAVSMLLGKSAIPVVFTGAQKPLATLRNDARTNFISALEVAAFAPKPLQDRVMVLFHDELYLGSRVRKKSALSFKAFESPRFPRLAQVGSSIQYEEIIHKLPALKKGNLNEASFNMESPQILCAELTPEFPSSFFTKELLERLDGIRLTLYTSATAPTANAAFIDFLKRAKNCKTPLFAITEREDAPANLSSYEAGKTLLDQGVLWCKDLTPEAALVKAWILRARNAKLSKKQYLTWLKRNWAKPVSDETTSAS